MAVRGAPTQGPLGLSSCSDAVPRVLRGVQQGAKEGCRAGQDNKMTPQGYKRFVSTGLPTCQHPRTSLMKTSGRREEEGFFSSGRLLGRRMRSPRVSTGGHSSSACRYSSSRPSGALLHRINVPQLFADALPSSAAGGHSEEHGRGCRVGQND